jgi:hypothetical protein
VCLCPPSLVSLPCPAVGSIKRFGVGDKVVIGAAQRSRAAPEDRDRAPESMDDVDDSELETDLEVGGKGGGGSRRHHAHSRRHVFHVEEEGELRHGFSNGAGKMLKVMGQAGMGAEVVEEEEQEEEEQEEEGEEEQEEEEGEDVVAEEEEEEEEECPEAMTMSVPTPTRAIALARHGRGRHKRRRGDDAVLSPRASLAVEEVDEGKLDAPRVPTDHTHGGGGGGGGGDVGDDDDDDDAFQVRRSSGRGSTGRPVAAVVGPSGWLGGGSRAAPSVAASLGVPRKQASAAGAGAGAGASGGSGGKAPSRPLPSLVSPWHGPGGPRPADKGGPDKGAGSRGKRKALGTTSAAGVATSDGDGSGAEAVSDARATAAAATTTTTAAAATTTPAKPKGKHRKAASSGGAGASGSTGGHKHPVPAVKRRENTLSQCWGL